MFSAFHSANKLFHGYRTSLVHVTDRGTASQQKSASQLQLIVNGCERGVNGKLPDLGLPGIQAPKYRMKVVVLRLSHDGQGLSFGRQHSLYEFLRR